MIDEEKKKEFSSGAEGRINGPANVKMVSLGWGQEEIKPFQEKGLVLPNPKSKSSYFFVKHP